MLSLKEARQIALGEINKHAQPEDECVIENEKTIEKEWGWVFFYNSRKYIETQDEQYQMFGNAPIIVNKNSGEIRFTGTAEPIDVYIKEYEELM